MKQFQFFLEREKGVHINTYCWSKDDTNPPKAVIQLAHGMAEHILRYENFSRFLVEQGFIVYGNDHRGHGGSIIAPDDKGFFADENGFEKAVGDMRALSLHIKEKHSDLPLIMFGHSMGSFLTRRYIQLHGEDLADVILSGTGGSQGLLGKIGLLVAKWERHRLGARTPSPLMNKLTFGNFNKAFEPARTEFDFLSRDVRVIDAYIADENCGFICSTAFYIDLIQGIELIHKKEEMDNIPKQLPIFLIAGDMDPVGNYGEGVKEVYNQYHQLGLENIHIHLYKDARHEILNELNKNEVYEDISKWIQTVL